MGSFSRLRQGSTIFVAATVAAAATNNVPDRFMKPPSLPILQKTTFQTRGIGNSNFASQGILGEPIKISPVHQILQHRTSHGTLKNCDFFLNSDRLEELRKVPFSGPPCVLLNFSQLPNIFQTLISSDKLINSEISVGSTPFGDRLQWHVPEAKAPLPSEKPAVVVVLLGWLGSQQRHLKKYAEWYKSRGIYAITFTLPLKDVWTYCAGGKVEKHIDFLVKNLILWMKEENRSPSDKYIVFHTFSNTGWLTYGAVLERLYSSENDLINKIKGVVIDSAPAAAPDPHVWASGFSAALLKKQSIAVKELIKTEANLTADPKMGDLGYPAPDVVESVLIVLLENIFKFVFRIPCIERRLTKLIDILSHRQPPCPQLYFYSSADRVIPAKSVEEFIEKQKQGGHSVRALDFVYTPHVDHFRKSPARYSTELTKFLEACLPHYGTHK